MRRSISIILSLIMILTAVLLPVSVSAEDKLQGTISSSDIKKFKSSNAVGSIAGNDKLNTKYSVNNVTYDSDVDNLEKIVRDKFVARSKKFNINYASKTNSLGNSTGFKKFVSSMINGAFSDEISVNCKDGDYLLWNFSGLSYYLADSTKSNNIYYYTITISDVSFYTTTDEEKAVDSYVASYFKTFNRGNMTDYQLVKKFHDDIIKMTVYDDEAAEDMDSNDHSFTAYGVFKKKKAVCQGYALAFYRLCKEADIGVRFVYSAPDEGCHAWNIVSMGGKYYTVDCTWDDNELPTPSYQYFLKTYSESRANDGSSKTHTYDSELMTSYFITNYMNKCPTSSFNINAPLLSNVSFSLSSNSYTYSGNYYTPAVNGKISKNESGSVSTVTFDDYTVKYTNNKNAGNAHVVITGNGDYANSTVSRKFVIGRKSISPYSVSLSTTKYTYSGKEKKPSAKLGSLKSNTDYTTSYSSNKMPGTATAKVTGIGNYYGTKSVNFTIIPSKITSVKVKKRTSTSLTLTYKKASGVDGYYIYQKKKGKWVKIKTTKSNTVTVSKLSPTTSYDFKVRGYKGKISGEYSSTLQTATSPKTTSIKSKSTKSRAITIKYGKVKCTGYQVQYSTSKSFSSSKTKTKNVSGSSKTTAKMGSLKKRTTYYIRVRTYKSRKLSSGKAVKYYSSWSKVAKITCK